MKYGSTDRLCGCTCQWNYFLRGNNCIIPFPVNKEMNKSIFMDNMNHQMKNKVGTELPTRQTPSQDALHLLSKQLFKAMAYMHILLMMLFSLALCNEDIRHDYKRMTQSCLLDENFSSLQTKVSLNRLELLRLNL